MADTERPQLEPAIFVIFGITGDLSRRKLLPALYYLIKNNLLAEHTAIVGVTRQDMTAEQLLDETKLGIDEASGTADPAVIQKLHNMLQMFQVDLTNGEDYDRLHAYLDEIEDQHGVCMNRLFYLSIPPQVYGPVVRQLGEHGLQRGCQHGTTASRLLIEKPFGYDLRSAEELINEIAHYFKEEQMFRIDHYVAKETVQNILTFRFENPLFKSIWNSRHISHLEITATEQIDIEGRATFYEEIGALRDFVQSHLLQLLAILTMDQPSALKSEPIHMAKLQALQAVKPITSNEVWQNTVRGQYDGYREEVKNPHSHRETYAALRLEIDNDQWRDVPILIRTGKALKQKETKLSVIFRDRAGEVANSLRFRIQPDEGIALHLLAKKPGYDDETQHVTMDFSYARVFDDHGHPDAYERVLVDAVRGDHTLFSTSEEVLASWRVLEHVVETWDKSHRDLRTYAKGSEGPVEANDLAKGAACSWL